MSVTSTTGSVFVSFTEVLTPSRETPLPALTTLFTPPASCFTDIFIGFPGPLDVAGYFIFPQFKQECFPPYGATAPTFSPGLCPLNFSTVTQRVTVLSGATMNELTQVTCCPLSFTINNPSSLQNTTSMFCETITTPTGYFGLVMEYYPTNTTIATASFIYNSVSISTPVGAIASATAFIAMWQKTDTAIIELLASLNSSASSSASLSPMPSSGATLSGGAIAGIVVGALIGSTFIGTLLIYLCIRWRRKSTGNGESGAENNWQKPELEGIGIGRQEFPGKVDPQELQGSELPPVELPGASLSEPHVDGENDGLPMEEHQQLDVTYPGEVARIEPS